MRRRDFVIAAIAAGGSLATRAAAQSARKLKRVGWIGAGTGTTKTEVALSEAFVGRLRELGWIEGRTIEFVKRHPEGDERRVEALAREVMAERVDLIFAPFGPHAMAVHKVTRSVPLIFAIISDPVRVGLTTSLARPDQNATGPSTVDFDLWGLRIQLLREAVPAAHRIAVLMNPDVEWHNRVYAQVSESCKKLGLEALQVPVRRREDFGGAIERALRERAGGLVHMPDGLYFNHRRALVESVAHTRLAAIYTNFEAVDDGGLMSYSIDILDVMRKAADYVDRVLRGASPSELPIERPTRVYLVLNLKTAKAQGIKFPQSLLIRADRVIE